MLALHNPSEWLNGCGRLWMPQPYIGGGIGNASPNISKTWRYLHTQGDHHNLTKAHSLLISINMVLSCELLPESLCIFWVSLSGVDGYVASVAGDKFVLQSWRELWRMLSCQRLSAHVKISVLQHLRGPGEHRHLFVNCNRGRIQGVQRIWEFGHQEGEKRKRMMLGSLRVHWGWKWRRCEENPPPETLRQGGRLFFPSRTANTFFKHSCTI